MNLKRVLFVSVVAVCGLSVGVSTPHAQARPVAAPPAAAPAAAACAATPDDAWRLAREAVDTKDAGKVMMTLTPTFRGRNAIEYAVGASMIIGMSGISATKAQEAKVAAMEKSLNTQLDAILTKHKAMTIAQIGKPLLPRMEAPEVVAKFKAIDHAAFARDMEAFFPKIGAAAKAAGLKPDEGGPSMSELVVGSGDIKAPLTGLKITGDSALAGNGKVNIKFAKLNGCWLVDGNEMK